MKRNPLIRARIPLCLALALSCLWSLFALCLFPVHADPAEDITGDSAGFASILYDSSSGLPTSEANAIAQTSEGFIWIGSYSGLIRYDGNQFHRFDASVGLSSVVCLFVDSRDRLWIGTNDKGVAVYDHLNFTFFNGVEGMNSAIHSIVEDKNGNILIATTMGLAYVDPENQLHLIDDPQLNTEYICELRLASDGKIYGVTLSGDFFTVENLRVGEFYSGSDLGIPDINTLFPDPADPDWIYLGTTGNQIIHGNLKEELADAKVYTIDPQHTVNALYELNGMIWACTDSGIGFINRQGGYTVIRNIPMTNSVDHMMVDYEGNLWFTSSRRGVMKIVENSFMDISRAAQLDTMVINTTCMYNGDLYLGTDSGLVILDARNQVKETPLTEAMQGVRIRCIREDSRGTLWLSTYSALGLVAYDGENWRSYVREDGLASDRARSTMELMDGTIAVATNGGVNLIRDGEITATYNGSQGIGNLEILCLEQNEDGRLYLGSDGDGIYVVNGRRISRLGLDDGLNSEVILRMKKEPDRNRFWIVTSNSLAYMEDDKITTIENFPYTNNFDLFFDENDRIWILSSNGVYVVKRDDLLRDAPEMEYTLYDTKCGLPSVATANSFSYLSPEGELYIAGSSKVSSVNINGSGASNNEIRLSIPFVSTDDTMIEVNGASTLRIPADCKRLSIYAYAFTYSLNNPRIRYQLEGFDDTAFEMTKQDMPESIQYTNLDGGSYTFTISLVNTMTGKVDQSLSLTIIKEKGLLEQIWFWILVALASLLVVALGIVLYFRRKTAILLRQQEEHKQFINELTTVMAKCIDMKDAYTNGHSLRVAKYTAMFARRLGYTDEEVEDIYNIALLHDIGKISIPDAILNKPGRLTDEEYAVMKNHPRRGYEILKEIAIAPDLALGAGYHHERIDGEGYPFGLSGDEIPEKAQIIAVADTFDAMYSTRPYRKRMELSVVAEEIKRVAGTQLNPKVVEVFLQLVEEGAFKDE